MADAERVLDIRGLVMNFGGLRAVDQLDLDVKRGEIVALIGPNGAGKTTVFNCVTGIYRPTSGQVYAVRPGRTAERIDRLKPNQVTEGGLARTFQNIRLFPHMTALENVMVGRHCRTSGGVLAAVLRGGKTQAEERDTVARAYRWLETVGLAGYVNEFAMNLPYGAQRRLEIARALATDPFLLLLDEPAAGMNPNETAELDELISRIRDQHPISILLIEHDMQLVMSLSDRIFVMDYGRKIAEGTPQQIRENPAVIKAYLGEEVE